MRKMSFRTRLWLLILLTALLIGLTTFAVGKYITTVSVKSSVTFTATLAEKVLLQEHKAVRQTDGSYQLDDTSIVQANTYTLIPGLDVPKDPHIVIKNKTPIPAYLYVEIVDELDTVTIDGSSVKLINYAVNEHWSKVETAEMTPKHEGTVYKYNTPLNETNCDDPIYILKDNEVIVSQYLKSYSDENKDVLTFYAYLVEATD